jgi:nucleotidyltransferase substrate binding protein (TIGR01987 family)
MTTGADVKLDELRKAIDRLKKALALPKSDVIRDAVIQRFEFTVDLGWKALQRCLKSSGVVESLTPKNTFREGARLGIVKNPEAWIRFVDARNLSSHSYKESLAEEVYASALILPPFAEELVQSIERTL